VYYASDLAEADIVAAWLEDQGVQAHVKNRYTAGTLQTPLLVAPKGIEVCVVNPADLPRAKALISDHLVERDQDKISAGVLGPVDATCEECGRTSRFPAEQRGAVQNCPQCGEYVDVPQ
jgi:hypothetical protein